MAIDKGIEGRIQAATEEAKELRRQIKENSEAKLETTLSNFAKDIPKIEKCAMKCRRTLRGHLGKVYAVSWAFENSNIASASQDGKMIIWDALTTNKLSIVKLRCSWATTCSYSPSGNFVASGGLDNICAIYHLDSDYVEDTVTELSGHRGYLSCCRFLNDRQMLTSSGDGSCVLWDISCGVKITEFKDHQADVMSLSIAPNKEAFVSGGCDNTAILWDLQTGKAEVTYTGHVKDINCVEYFPNGNAFASGSDDGTCRLFDIRADKQLMQYELNYERPFSSIAFSASGRCLFASQDDTHCRVWDSLKGEEPIGELKGHQNRINSVSVSKDGCALATGSWDATVKIWA